MNNINIICYKYNKNKFDEIPYKINILFVPFEKDNYISNQTLFNLHGNYKLEIVENTKKNIVEETKKNIIEDTKKKTVQFSEKKEIINETFISADNRETHRENHRETIVATETDTDVLDMIPDIIRLSETDENIDNDTTDTIELISHNLK